mmetsp:Transcript_1731/g.3676  ORF Transcript_1731/g.3676 Transcript_1731/m.3676 type:complete len:228 (+) Transcript_1731:1604-2287(+)
MEKLLLPRVSLIRKGSFFKPKPSFALIFAVHTMLMSIFELQGDGDIFRIRDVAKNSFDRFMSQAGEHLESEIPCHTKRKSLLKFITDTKRVTEKSDDADFEKAYPMMSKELHDLLIHELVDDDLPLLADIDRYFEKTKCIWNGWDKPQQGKFVYRLHLSMAQQMKWQCTLRIGQLAKSQRRNQLTRMQKLNVHDKQASESRPRSTLLRYHCPTDDTVIMISKSQTKC